jgi:hypothetical protein
MAEPVALKIMIVVNCRIEKLPLHDYCFFPFRLQAAMKRSSALTEKVSGEDVFSVLDVSPGESALDNFYQKNVPGKVSDMADMVCAKLRERFQAKIDRNAGQGAGADNVGHADFADTVEHDKSRQARVNDDFFSHAVCSESPSGRSNFFNYPSLEGVASLIIAIYRG